MNIGRRVRNVFLDGIIIGVLLTAIVTKGPEIGAVDVAMWGAAVGVFAWLARGEYRLLVANLRRPAA